MKKYLFLLLLSAPIFAEVDCVNCTSTNKQPSSPGLSDVKKVINTCISFGEKSVSGKLQASGIIYKTASGFKVIYDGDDVSKMGKPFASKVEIDTQVPCGENFKGQIHSSEFVMNDNMKVSGPIPFFFPSGSCPSQSIKLRIMTPACISPSPECSKLVAKETVSFVGSNLSWLDTISDDQVKSLPCFKH